MSKILIVDSNPAIAGELKSQLAKLGMKPLWATGGREAIRHFVSDTPDAVVLCEAVPDVCGWETAELIRTVSDAPMIFISDRPDRLSRNRALQLGDDYLSPPWEWERLRARLVALVRRSSAQHPALLGPYDDGFLRVDIAGGMAFKNGTPLEMTHTEFKLLSCFIGHPNLALSHGDILQSVWGHRYLKAKSDVSQYVRYLRQKIEADPPRPTYLRTVRGIGYLFAPRAGVRGSRGLPISHHL